MMRKLITTIIVALFFSVITNAQVYLGGSIGGSFAKENSNLNIYPEVGYCINGLNSIGAVIGVSTDFDSSTAFYASLYYDRSFPITDYLSFNLIPGVDYTNNHNAHNIGVYLGTNLEYFVTDNLSIWGGFDFIRFDFANTKYDYHYDTYSMKFNSFNLDFFDSGIKFGVYFYL